MKKTKIYLFPGLMCDKRVFKDIYFYLENEYELIYVDIPLEDSFDKMIENLNFKEEKVNLLGFSMGAYLATYFALKYPKKIDNLLILSASCCSLSKSEIAFRKKAISFVKEFGFKPLSRKKISSLLENKDDLKLITLISNMYEKMGENYFLTHMNASLKRKDLTEQIVCSNLNLNFCYSNKDSLINQKWFENLKNKSNCNFNIINSSSHMITLEKSIFIVDEIRRVF
ncbi:hypothetical protein CPG37_07555 [Malaciobacter canalis]|uniref:Serine aminopeptidase S33 domain-containing protein n=1 Tax=Malaciobacter canalis TaxID=1912871 RepID=A0ABX4LQ48_9BACT|nr:alpha/beta fold hydrolase [Malaciobacter canalis]PHO09858.1 hypothetical protein CPG37_07555 [Malaciobacter canalis]QEE33477.1 alpha/beta hydrolase family protein [Malaciobacter canalis]